MKKIYMTQTVQNAITFSEATCKDCRPAGGSLYWFERLENCPLCGQPTVVVTSYEYLPEREATA